jgi:hypothetical protein
LKSPGCGRDERRDGLGAEILNAIEWINTAFEQHLALEHIADAGDDPLVQQDVGNCFSRVGPDARRNLVRVKRGTQWVRPQRIQDDVPRQPLRREPLGFGDLKADRQPLRRGDDDAHVGAGAAPSFAGSSQVPAAVHAQMGSKDQILPEGDEDVFSASVNRCDLAPSNSTADRQGQQLWKAGFELSDLCACQGAMQGAGRTENRIALRHASRLFLEQLRDPIVATAARRVAGDHPRGQTLRR